MQTDPLVSIIVPCYNVATTVERCLNSILTQTYNNLEVICVNDGSTDSTVQILERFKADKKIILLNHDKNKGLFHARLTGVKYAHGAYISFVDSDDYISIDFIRCLVNKAENTGADLTMCKTVHEKNNNKYVHNSYYNADFDNISQNELFNKYMEQEGSCFIWHTVWNKLYSKTLWDLAMPYLEKQDKHLIMAEDLAYSSVLFYFANKMSSVDYSYYFYFQNENASTSLDGKNTVKMEKNINDLGTAFSFVESFFNQVEISKENLQHFKKWRDLYSRFWADNIKNTISSASDRKKLNELLKKAFKIDEIQLTSPSDHYFYRNTTKWDGRYEQLLTRLCRGSEKIVSFDVFDTLLVRPLYDAHDLFRLVEHHMKVEQPSNIPFHSIRHRAEAMMRTKNEEVTIKQIYDCMCNSFGLNPDFCAKCKDMEEKLELKFLEPRKSIKNVYEMLRYLNKKMIVISDFYMDAAFIKKALKSSGYEFDNVFVSSEYNKTKQTGSLYDVVLKSLNTSPNNIIHIGDNWHSDKIMAENKGYSTWFYAKAMDAYLYHIPDIPASHIGDILTKQFGEDVNRNKALEFIGFRCSIAIVANKLYDNPYAIFSANQEFGCNLKHIGFGALGPYIWGISQWLINNHKKDCKTIHFIARDGYLPMKAFDIMNKNTNIKSNYIYVSRKSLMPLKIESPSDFYSISSDINYKNTKYSTVIKGLSPIINDAGELYAKYGDNTIESEDNFLTFIADLRNHYDEQKNIAYRNQVKKYFKNIILPGDEMFDIGYSGRTQILLSKLLEFPINASFIHCINDSNYEDLSTMGISINTYYDYTPCIIGGIREYIISELHPSCIGYSENGPVFEDYNLLPCTKFVIDQLQLNALDFVKKITDLFSEWGDMLNTRATDISIPFELFVNRSSTEDRWMFEMCDFEDELYYGRKSNLVNNWNDAISYFKLLSMPDRLKRNSGTEVINIGMAKINTKTKKALYYLLFDFKQLVKRIKKH